MINKPWQWFVALLCLATGVTAQASIIIDGTRVVYPGNAREVTVQLRNTASKPALVQSWIDSGDSKATPESSDAPFIITPPITRVEAGAGQALRLAFIGADLPADQESVFWLNVLEVPPLPEADASRNYMQLAFRSRIKLFYRPAGLAGTANRAPSQLRWSITENGGAADLIVSNPTPYHITVTRIELVADGQTIVVPAAGVMIGPRSKESFALDGVAAAVAPERVHFTTINDYGGRADREFRF